MKDEKEVIQEFNEIVNMTAAELEKWLKSDDSQSAGWPKDEDGGGESVGHDSGRKIVEILKSNPGKKEDKYTDEQVQHMRKVVSYCKRHLAQEEKSNSEKPAEEVKKTKSYASLKNWGHDPLKARGEGGEEEQEGDDEDEKEEKQAGDKRKKDSEAQSGSNKKRETKQGKSEQNGDDEEDEEEDEDGGEQKTKKQQANGNKKSGQKKKDEGEGEDEEEEEDDDKENGDSGSKPKKGPEKGDTVSWNWGNGQPQGKVLDVKGEKATIETKRGNEVSRDGDPEDPAVVLDTGKSKAIKSNHELN